MTTRERSAAPSPGASSDAKRLLRLARVGALATIDGAAGAPLTTLVGVASDWDGSPLFLMSELSRHTRNLAVDARASLLLTSTGGRGDPLNRPRLTVGGPVAPHPDPTSRRRYLQRNPKAGALCILHRLRDPAAANRNDPFQRRLRPRRRSERRPICCRPPPATSRRSSRPSRVFSRRSSPWAPRRSRGSRAFPREGGSGAPSDSTPRASTSPRAGRRRESIFPRLRSIPTLGAGGSEKNSRPRLPHEGTANFPRLRAANVALELATFGVTANCVSPGYVWTPLVENQIPDTMKARGHDARTGDQRRDLGGAADQAIRHRRSGRRARRLSLLGQCRADHRGQFSIDGGWTAA